MSDLKPYLQKIATGARLSAEEAAGAFEIIMSGEATPSQIGGLLMGMRARGEAVEEIVGAARVIRSKVLKVEAPAEAMDIVGTGGDHSGSFNVSTCAALVVAGAGVPIAKHGNRAVSSRSGAGDVLGALGVKIGIEPALISRAIREAGVGFMFAPAHHASFKFVGPTRAELGTRTIFNLLGPLSNPAGVRRILMGVYAGSWVEPIARALRDLGTEAAWVVHGSDGLDEITTTGPTAVCELKAGEIRAFEITPEQAGLNRARPEELKGASPEENAASLRGVLKGTPGPLRDIVLMNSGAALVVAGKARDLETGVGLAARSIESGAAQRALDTLIAVTNA